MTGVVASKSVTEASKGALRTIGNRPQSVMAKDIAQNQMGVEFIDVDVQQHSNGR